MNLPTKKGMQIDGWKEIYVEDQGYRNKVINGLELSIRVFSFIESRISAYFDGDDEISSFSDLSRDTLRIFRYLNPIVSHLLKLSDRLPSGNLPLQ